MPSDVLRVKIDLRLEIEDVGDFEVTDCQLSFGLNEIPTAQCVLAIGRNALDTSKRAKIHESATYLKSMRKAKIYATITGDFSEDKKWPEGEKMIFDGRLCGTGFNRMLGQAGFTVHLIHWLADLSFSSILSEQSHPGNPTQYTFPAIRRNKGNTGAKDSSMFGSVSAKSLFTWDNLEEDLWGKALQPTLCQLAQTDLIQLTDNNFQLAEKVRKNDLALAALARMEGGGCGATPSEYTPPLSLIHDGSLTGAVANAIRTAVGSIQQDAWAASTVWDLLVGPMAQMFMFGVVPQVDRALVVPTLPGFSETYEIGINANDYDFAELSGAIPRPLRAVGIFSGVAAPAGAMTGGNFKIGAMWPEEGDADYEIPEGMVRIVSAPSWLSNVAAGEGAARSTSGTAQAKPTGTATTPVTDSTKPDIPNNGETKAERTSDAEGLYKRLAHAIYVTEALRGRNGSVSGKLRFDICPGSTIKLEGQHEVFIGSSDKLGQDLYGMVTKVSIGLNANQGRAGTGFMLSGIRDETENGDKRFTVEKHPLYDQAFKGAPLVADYKIT